MHTSSDTTQVATYSLDETTGKVTAESVENVYDSTDMAVSTPRSVILAAMAATGTRATSI